MSFRGDESRFKIAPVKNEEDSFGGDDNQKMGAEDKCNDFSFEKSDQNQEALYRKYELSSKHGEQKKDVRSKEFNSLSNNDILFDGNKLQI